MADGKLKRIESINQLKAGCVVRENGREIAPFSDCVVMTVDKEWNKVKCSRPYAYVSGAGTTSPTILLGHETFQLDFDELQKHYMEVVTDRENHYDFVT